VKDAARKKILVVEDEPDIRELVRYNLENAGFAVVEADDGEAALAAVHKERPAMVILDLMLPEADGMEICRILRAGPETAKLPIVMLTAKAGEVDRVLGLEFGADDYVTKPFSPRELVARVRAVLRRAEGPEIERVPEVYERGRLRIDFDSHEAWLDGKPLELSLREFELLKFFVRNPNRVFDRLAILDLVWGHDTYVEPRTVDVHVRRLRLLVERDPARPQLIHTVRGVGYKFNDQGLEKR
jgi:two-component system, OmpR family, alkaline phosphatase synthesis response regulator PhoP